MLGFRFLFEILRYCRSYPSVRKCTEYIGINMSTNMVNKKSEHGGTPYHYVRKCNARSVLTMIAPNGMPFLDRVVVL